MKYLFILSLLIVLFSCSDDKRLSRRWEYFTENYAKDKAKNDSIVFMAQGAIQGGITGFSTYIITKPKYDVLVKKIKKKVKINSLSSSDGIQKIKAYFNKRLANAGSKLVDNLNLGNFSRKIGDYKVFDNGEVFYRGMSQADYQYLLTNGKIRAPVGIPQSEVFTSPSLEYIKSVGYGGDGVIVKFKMKSGTLDNLVSNGVRDQSNRASALFPDMQSTNISGWEANGKVYFKQETIKNTTTKQVNIGLGKNESGGLNLFNGQNGDNILEFQIVE